LHISGARAESQAIERVQGALVLVPRRKLMLLSQQYGWRKHGDKKRNGSQIAAHRAPHY
jgi:hypothetical protein